MKIVTTKTRFQIAYKSHGQKTSIVYFLFNLLELDHCLEMLIKQIPINRNSYNITCDIRFSMDNLKKEIIPISKILI